MKRSDVFWAVIICAIGYCLIGFDFLISMFIATILISTSKMKWLSKFNNWINKK